ncbi:hypothetical protein TI39_contig306g00012 [Zymoseptoria brevis]|uniref:Uncharacterized protein n=1 Tax=Zymoseptoria brevis TaxID=1047168 RepID=A0A0F4GUA1_9PEZI|nr:hypothetical protein TI39_contig306g00012 [Zymoseptoria brevis]
MSTKASEQTTASLLREAAENLSAMSATQQPTTSTRSSGPSRQSEPPSTMCTTFLYSIQYTPVNPNLSPLELQEREGSLELANKAELAHDYSSSILESAPAPIDLRNVNYNVEVFRNSDAASL